jgi:hypothetical protein
VRISVGIEDVGDLITDLNQALPQSSLTPADCGLAAQLGEER